MLEYYTYSLRAFPEPGPSGRKLRLFACACCRAVWHLLADERSRRAVEVAERYADGLATEEELNEASQEATRACRHHENSPLFAPAWIADPRRFLIATERLRSQDGSQYDRAAGAAQAALLREVAGNPLRPVELGSGEVCGKLPHGHCDRWRGHAGQHSCSVARFDTAWLTPTVLALARAAYDERLDGGTLDPARLAVLADALEEGGCTAADLLTHLRSLGPHVRGCWALDLLLGKV